MMRKNILMGAALWLLVIAFVVGGVIYQRQVAREFVQPLDQDKMNLAQLDSPSLGNPNARVHIVEFLDPACETCAAFYPYVKQIMAANPDQIRLTIHHVPFHKGSDYAVKALEAARSQGKYWQLLEALLASQVAWARNHAAQAEWVWEVVRGVDGLDLEQMKTDMNSPETVRRMERDSAYAKWLNVTQTPEFFVNDRPLPSFGLEQLQGAVQDALKRAK